MAKNERFPSVARPHSLDDEQAIGPSTFVASTRARARAALGSIFDLPS